MRAIVRAAALVIALALPAAAQPPQDSVRFATDAEKARAHLLVSEELYVGGQGRTAAVHAAHPVQELGNRLIGPVRKVDSARADRLRDLLKAPGRALESKVDAARYAATVASVGVALDDAITVVAGAAPRASLAFRARVVAALLAGMAEEYDEAFKNGRITQVIEYQDAYAFFRRARMLYGALPAEARRADADVATLAKAFPSREPPAPPMPLDAVKDLARRIGAAVTP